MSQPVFPESNAQEEADYTGDEPALDWTETQPRVGELFIVRPPNLTPAATPIFDEETNAVIGFEDGSGGVRKIYDLEGSLLRMEEKGLETPWFDPIDLLFIGGGLLRSAGKGGTRIVTRLITGGVRGAATTLEHGLLALLRIGFKKIAGKGLRFTVTTIARMESRDRYVPLHILQFAIKYGARSPDPRKAFGAYQFLIPIIKNGRPRMLKVVLREFNNTILHFHYWDL